MPVENDLIFDTQEVEDPANEEDNEAPTDLRYQISSYGADYPVDSLVKRLRNKDVVIPKFQRGFVWPLPQASKFIESLLLGLPVPAIFLSKDVSNRLVIIDGQQRLYSLLSFYDGKFRGKDFALQGVNKPFDGLTYKKLPIEDRRRLDDAIIHAIIIRQEDPRDDDSSIFLVFERLNTTSTPLSEQEIRACVYYGGFNKYLNTLNGDPNWRTIYGPINPRQKDIELVLRFFALFLDRPAYERPMKLFLASFMKKNRNFELYQPEYLDSLFRPTIQLANNHLGPTVFRPERALNASVTDAILVGTTQRLQTGPINDTTKYAEVVQNVVDDEKFLSYCRAGTTNKDKIEGRIGMLSYALTNVD